MFARLVTLAPNASPTKTPFQPVPNTPTITSSPTPTLTPTATVTMTPTVTNTPEPQPDILVGAGDISACDQDGDNHTSELLASIPGEIFTTGDNSNERGTPGQYTDCFDYSWGRYMDRLRPVPGNHDQDHLHRSRSLGFTRELARDILTFPPAEYPISLMDIDPERLDFAPC